MNGSEAHPLTRSLGVAYSRIHRGIFAHLSAGLLHIASGVMFLVGIGALVFLGGAFANDWQVFLVAWVLILYGRLAFFELPGGVAGCCEWHAKEDLDQWTRRSMEGSHADDGKGNGERNSYQPAIPNKLVLLCGSGASVRFDGGRLYFSRYERQANICCRSKNA